MGRVSDPRTGRTSTTDSRFLHYRHLPKLEGTAAVVSLTPERDRAEAVVDPKVEPQSRWRRPEPDHIDHSTYQYT